jgi:hypothetical protein
LAVDPARPDRHSPAVGHDRALDRGTFGHSSHLAGCPLPLERAARPSSTPRSSSELTAGNDGAEPDWSVGRPVDWQLTAPNVQRREEGTLRCSTQCFSSCAGGGHRPLRLDSLPAASPALGRDGDKNDDGPGRRRERRRPAGAQRQRRARAGRQPGPEPRRGAAIAGQRRRRQSPVRRASAGGRRRRQRRRSRRWPDR